MTAGKRDPRSIDAIDLKILSALLKDGRMSKVALARAVGLSPTPCSMRIDRLEAAGLIRGYRADIDVERLGDLSQFIVTVSIKEGTPEKSRQFELLVGASLYIVACDAAPGPVDYVMHVFARNVRHYHEIMEPFLVMEIDYTTYPISKKVTDRAAHDLFGLLDVESRASNAARARTKAAR